MVVGFCSWRFFGEPLLAGASFVPDRCRFDGHIGIWVGSGLRLPSGPPITLDGLWIHLVWTWCRGDGYHAAALAYGMVVGEAEVDAGGTFESLIGLGYAGVLRRGCWGFRWRWCWGHRLEWPRRSVGRAGVDAWPAAGVDAPWHCSLPFLRAIVSFKIHPS